MVGLEAIETNLKVKDMVNTNNVELLTVIVLVFLSVRMEK